MRKQTSSKKMPTCPISGLQMEPWLFVPGDWIRPSNKNSYQLYWCEKSKLGCQYPIPSQSELSALYEHDNYYTHNLSKPKSTATSTISWLNRLRIHLAWRFDHGNNITPDWFSSRFGSEPRSICEIGCGNGKLLKELVDMGHSVVGVEPDAVSRGLAKENFDLSVFSGTAECLPEEVMCNQYDIVIMCHVLEHTTDPIFALENVRKLLKPEGKLIIETPNNEAISLTQSGITWFCLRVPEHLYFFTKDSLYGVCDKANLKVISTEFSNYSRQFMSGYIQTEESIWDFFKSRGYRTLPIRNSDWQAWLLLMKTIFTTDEKKYDCVRIIAENNS